MELISPTGKRIKGTLETVQGCCLIQDVKIENGKISYECAGDTEMFWDTQTTTMMRGRPVFIDTDGIEWSEREIVKHMKLAGEASSNKEKTDGA